MVLVIVMVWCCYVLQGHMMGLCRIFWGPFFGTHFWIEHVPGSSSGSAEQIYLPPKARCEFSWSIKIHKNCVSSANLVSPRDVGALRQVLLHQHQQQHHHVNVLEYQIGKVLLSLYILSHFLETSSHLNQVHLLFIFAKDTWVALIML